MTEAYQKQDDKYIESKNNTYTRPTENTTRQGRHTMTFSHSPLPDTQDTQYQ